MITRITRTLLALIALCAYSSVSYASEGSWTWGGLFSHPIDTVGGWFEDWQKEKDTATDTAEEDDEEVIHLGENDDFDSDDLDSDDFAEEEKLGFSYEKLMAENSEVKLLDPAHIVFDLNRSGLLAKLNEYFLKNEQAAINLFISLERTRHEDALTILDSKKLNPAFRLAILLDTPVEYAVKIFTDLRNHFAGRSLYHWGSFTFSNPWYGNMQAQKAYIRGELVAMQYLGVLLEGNVDPNDLNTINERYNRLFAIAAFMSPEDIDALFIYKPEECVITIGEENTEVCFGRVKEKNLCNEEQASGLPPAFVAGMLQIFASDRPAVAVKILTHEKSFYPERCKAIVASMDEGTLGKMLPFLTKDFINFIAKIRPEVVGFTSAQGSRNGSILELAAGPSSGQATNHAAEEAIDDLLNDLI